MHVFLETDRLILRRFTEADLDNLVELDGDPVVMRYINGGRSAFIPTPDVVWEGEHVDYALDRAEWQERHAAEAGRVRDGLTPDRS